MATGDRFPLTSYIMVVAIKLKTRICLKLINLNYRTHNVVL